jgi:hypothetical protein
VRARVELGEEASRRGGALDPRPAGEASIVHVAMLAPPRCIYTECNHLKKTRAENLDTTKGLAVNWSEGYVLTESARI